MLEVRPIIKWRLLRKALGLSQANFAAILSISPRQIIKLEQAERPRCHDATLTMLRICLRDPELQSRLKTAGYPHPFPEDMRP